MKLEEAIELLNIAKEGFPLMDTEKYYKAMELGSEALKRLQRSRNPANPPEPDLLPGETEE